MHLLTRASAVTALAAVALSATASSVPAAASADRPATTAPTTASEARYLVRYAPGTDIAVQARKLRDQGVAVRRTFSHAVRAAAVTTTPARAAALARSPRVAGVEVDARVGVSDLQQDAPWGLDRVDQRALPLSTTFAAPALGHGVDVYVLDTGVRADHVDLAGRVQPGWTAIADGLGSGDCNGHGTHVAGTVAGLVHGVAKAAAIVPVRALDCDGLGYLSDIVAGLDWVAAHHHAGTPAVLNLSLGGPASQTVDAAVEAVMSDGVTATVAAGNSAEDACTSSPARVPGALTVAASDSGDRQAPFSNHGSCVDLYAPGVSILSAWHTSAASTATLSGTSMAAPHVAGAAAVLLEQHPTLTPAEVASHLTREATQDAVTAGTPGTANRLLFLVPASEPTPAPEPAPVLRTTPSAATDVLARAKRRSALVRWRQGDDGGSALTGQTIRVFRGGTKVQTVRVRATASRKRIWRLRPGAAYRFSVVARNEVGAGPASLRSNTVRPRR